MKTHVLLAALLWIPFASAGDRHVGDQYVDECFEEATQSVEQAYQSTIDLLNNPDVPNTPENLLKKERFPSAAAIKLAKAEEVVELTLECVTDKVGTTDPINVIVSAESFLKITAGAGCAVGREVAGEVPDCTDWCFHSKYRTINGICNNLANPLWGASRTAFPRLLPAFYENNINQPRGWKKGMLYNGYPIPSARLISTQVLSAKKIKLDCKYSHMLMQWGQFLDHDIDLAPISPIDIGCKTGISCGDLCENDTPCFPIPIPACDPRINTTKCFGFTRSSATCGSGHSFVARDQVNELTSYIDGSNVYGSIELAHDPVRDEIDRKFLKRGIEIADGKFLLPFDESGNHSACDHDINKPNSKCFLAGDIRANEQLGLTAMHTLWFREHNRLASALAGINPHWDDETVFQEARKIVGAQMQHITFVEWLPKLIGMTGMEKLGPYTGYDPTVNAAILNSFAAAVYRVGHALVNPIIKRLDSNFNEIVHGNLPLHEAFFNPLRIINEGGIDPVLRGFFFDSAKQADPGSMMNEELTEKLFKLAHQVALDLGALNIQRGRDHGLPSYVQVRNYCGLRPVFSFSDLHGEIQNRKILKLLKGVYGSVFNVDLFVGGLAEDPVQGSRVGPTFMCVIVEQFRRLRDGDRFFYENHGLFTSGQLKEIRKASLARIICDNGDDIDRVPSDAFRLTNNKHGLEKCDNVRRIPVLDLNAWRDGGCPGNPVVVDHEAAFDSSTQTCCCGNIFDFTGTSYRCCGENVYDPDADSCCDGILYCGKPKGVYHCCGKSLYSSVSEECVDGLVKEASKTRRCGNTVFYTLTEICCGGNVFFRAKRGTTCCGSNAYDPYLEICCHGEVRHIHSRFTQCCGTITFEANKEICCLDAVTPNGLVYPRPRSADNKDKHGNQMDECPSLTSSNAFINYIYLQDGCCCGKILTGQPLLTDESCCGYQPYNIWKELCCDGNIVAGDPKCMRCCGKHAYNPEKQACCDTSSGLILADCVGGCPLTVVAVCNGITYNVDDQVCCEGNLFTGGPNIRCCGDFAIDETTTTCCLGPSCKILTHPTADLNTSGECQNEDEPAP